MPSLWKKKSKVNRICRLVAELKSPPKRGGSLVVETGFPTSLVDLFVKNRDRLKKPSEKKRPKSPVDSPPIPSQSPTRLPSPPPTLLPSLSKQDESMCPIVSEMEEIGPQEADLSFAMKTDRKQEIKGMLDSNDGALFVLKVALVVILALCTKKLVLGMSMAAFLLILAEYFGGRVLLSSKPWVNAKQRLKSFFDWFKSDSLGKQENIGIGVENGALGGVVQEEDEDHSIVCDSCFVEGKVRNCPIDEIEIGQATFCSLDGMNEITPSEVGNEEMKVMEEGETGSEVGSMSGKEKKGKFWKKFVPKKLRKKKWKDKNGKPCDTELANLAKWEDVEEEERKEGREIINHKGSLSFSLEDGLEEEELAKEIEQSDGINGGKMEAGKYSERLERRDGNPKYLFMVMIVLVGLVRGRIVALVLTLICCLLFKMVKRAPWKSKTVPVVVPLIIVSS
ncbi:hypothetical protein Nepgr_029550 [Nepenthes gracilis]|uniref:Ethylene-responsive nuclear protein n=1 Tax=Nepenthes gracilis TaxID=150966 RepID=A0AAD3TFJ9_NEPGR|nr:hypothetical protein Nepgr_029550 [Nepenthes gracilis]